MSLAADVNVPLVLVNDSVVFPAASANTEAAISPSLTMIPSTTSVSALVPSVSINPVAWFVSTPPPVSRNVANSESLVVSRSLITPAFVTSPITVKVTLMLAASTTRVGSLPPPPTINDATDWLLVMLTVYVPARSITAVSVAVGTSPELQLLPTFQFPPLGLVQETTPDGAAISNAALVSGSNPVAVVTRVKPTPGRSMLRSVN